MQIRIITENRQTFVLFHVSLTPAVILLIQLLAYVSITRL